MRRKRGGRDEWLKDRRCCVGREEGGGCVFGGSVFLGGEVLGEI